MSREIDTCEFCFEEKFVIENDDGNMICEDCYLIWLENYQNIEFDEDEISELYGGDDEFFI